MIKYYLDTEFIEDGRTIDLISLALVSEDGREYYAVSNQCDFSKADDWVDYNVLMPMGLSKYGLHSDELGYDLDYTKEPLLTTSKYLRTKKQIKEEVLKFVGYETWDANFLPNCSTEFLSKRADGKILSPDFFIPEFWADYCSYDWVVFCQLFGRMIDLPEGFPMFCNDLQQLWRMKGCPSLPERKDSCHNALEDARFVKIQCEFLSSLSF